MLFDKVRVDARKRNLPNVDPRPGVLLEPGDEGDQAVPQVRVLQHAERMFDEPAPEGRQEGERLVRKRVEGGRLDIFADELEGVQLGRDDSVFGDPKSTEPPVFDCDAGQLVAKSKMLSITLLDRGDPAPCIIEAIFRN